MPDPLTTGGVGGQLALLPRRLSPSRAKDYLDCPKLFFERTILRVPSPGSVATVRGTLLHAVAERVFDLPAAGRTVDAALALVEPCWAQLTAVPDGDDARAAKAAEARLIAPAGSEVETAVLDAVRGFIRGWFAMERISAFSPATLVLPDGSVVDGRELHVEAPLPGPDADTGVVLHGYIDRLDCFTGGPVPRWAISDYKTGKLPAEGKDYPPATTARIVDEAFFALKAYALLAHDTLGVTAERLRLLYVKTGDPATGILTTMVTPELIAATRTELVTLWAGIVDCARTGSWPCTGRFKCKDHVDAAEAAA